MILKEAALGWNIVIGYWHGSPGLAGSTSHYYAGLSYTVH